MYQNHQLQPTSRASLEYVRLSETLDARNHQLHKTEKELQRLHKKVLVAIAVCALIAFAVFCAAVTLLTGGAA